MDKQAFSRWLDQQLDKRGVSPSQLAAYLGVSHVSVGSWCKGKYLPKPANIILMAEYFKVDTDWLLTLAEYRPNKPTNLEGLNPTLKL